MNFRKKIALTTLTLASGLVLAACGQQAANSDDIVASGEKVEVTNDEFVAEMKAIAGTQVLQQLILTDIFEDVIGEDRIKDLKTEAETETALLITQYGGEEAFQSMLESSGYTKTEDYQDALYYYKLMNEAVATKIDISDEELQSAYDKYEPVIEVSHILVDTEEEANNIIKQLDDGKDFAELAKEKSKDGSAENGGSLGEVSKGQMVAEFEEAAFALDEGKYSAKPVKTEYGFHIIYVTAKPEKGSFEDEKEQLKESLLQTKLNDSAAVQTIVGGLITDYKVTINDDELATALDSFKPKAETESETTESSSEASSQATSSAE